MNIRVDDAKNTVEIWVDSEESRTYKERSEYREIINRYKNTHSVVTYVGGNQALLPTLCGLLDIQTGADASFTG